MRKTISPLLRWSLLCIALFLLPSCRAPQGNFPGEQWEIVAKPEKLGYDSAKLAEAKEFAGTINTAAVVIVVDGKVLYQWGDVDKKFNTHSMRKSFLSAMFTFHAAIFPLNR